jgi:hypothetical protein
MVLEEAGRGSVAFRVLAGRSVQLPRKAVTISKVLFADEAFVSKKRARQKAALLRRRRRELKSEDFRQHGRGNSAGTRSSCAVMFVNIR